jgi:D-alanyl-D-alanine carboxypeptidase
MKHSLIILLIIGLISCNSSEKGAQKDNNITLTNEDIQKNNKKLQNLNTLVAKQIDSIRMVYNSPSIAYGVIRNDSVMTINAVGYRDAVTKDRAQPDDYYHIGSNTKSFTGLMAAKMVEDKLIEWDTKFFDLYPELKNKSNATYYDITLKELLSHRARLIYFAPDFTLKDPWSEIFLMLEKSKIHKNDSLNWSKKRYLLIKEILKQEALPPHEQNDVNYSNAGFIAAALMLEKVSGLTWESLITNLSTDLNLGIHIGFPREYGINQPKGHMNSKLWGDVDKEIPITIEEMKTELAGISYEYLQLCRPSGNISMSVESILKFLQMNINGLNGENNYLKPETYKQIFSTYPTYTIGWWDEPEEKLIYSHRGGTILFSSFAGISSEKKCGIVVFANADKHEAITKILNVLKKNYMEN